MTQSVADAMRVFSPPLPLGVAFSGGADSTALLVACAQKWPGQVQALHVNHGLQAAAASFEAQCRHLCETLDVPLWVSRVDARGGQGQSPEDAARIARYQALSALARMERARPAIKSIALAQHANDQVETLLLALSRGAGVAGLSAMPAQWQRDGLAYYRPWLGVAGADVRLWLAEQDFEFCEDPTNQDERFTRNRIRLRIMPALEASFPQFLDTFGRSALHAAQAQELLTEVAEQDWLAVAATGSGGEGPIIRALQSLSRARQANVLRHWLRQFHNVIPSSAQLAELLGQVTSCTTRGHQIHIKVGSGFVQRNRAVLTWYNP